MKIKLSFFLCLASIILLTGCSNGYENIFPLFSNYSSEILENYCVVKGTVQTENDSVDIVYIESSQDIDTSIEYSFTRSKGNIKIYYHSPDGTDCLLEDTSKENGSLVDGTCALPLEQGGGKIYFTGVDSTFDFNLCINVPEKYIQYFGAKSPQESRTKEQEYKKYEKQLDEKYEK